MGKIVILDNGHGGAINGTYQTEGKRSPNWEKGVLFEGCFNRWVVNRIIEKLDRMKIPYFHISPEIEDTTLQTRVNRTNRIHQTTNNVWVLSIHANAGGGLGIEGFTSVGNTASDVFGEKVLTNLKSDITNANFRFDYTDGDKDKEVNFFILKNTNCPAFLLECGFMDNKTDYNNLWNEDYINALVNSIVKSIQQIYLQ